ncbi:MAG: site-2 protease family protein [Clostridia bacterium]|nr:site-2 protease family protein [Clostridia bacterium]
MEYFVYLLASFLAVMIVITLHEFAHAFVAYKCGDPTPKMAGRLSLNPVKHFDLLGILAFAFVGFGWAKPVPVNPYNFKNGKWGSFFTSVAGVAMNFLFAFAFYPIAQLVFQFVLPKTAGTYMSIFLFDLVLYIYTYSLTFCIFNLLPFYPLDGFRMVDALNKKRGKIYMFLRNYGYYILLALMFVHILADRIYLFAYIDLLGYFMSFAMNILGWPITAFWGLFF